MYHCLLLLFLFLLLVPLFGNHIIELLHYLNLDTTTTSIVIKTLDLLSGPLSWLIVFLFIKTIYTMAPDKKFSSRHVTGGALFTTLAWIGITELYSYYITHYANYSVFYGGLANIVILMVWVYFLSYAFVIGMAMNYHQDLEKTGVIEINKLIEESANSAPVLPEEEKTKKKKKKKEKQQETQVVEEKNEEENQDKE